MNLVLIFHCVNDVNEPVEPDHLLLFRAFAKNESLRDRVMPHNRIYFNHTTVAGRRNFVAPSELHLYLPLLSRNLQQVAAQDDLVFQVH